jgi:uncharacterized protein
MFFRLLLLFLVVWFLIWLIKKQFAPDTEDSTQDSPQEAEDMLACKLCGTHVPKSLAVIRDQQAYCCSEHADQDEQH